MATLPNDELALLDQAIGPAIASIQLCTMRDCGEEFRTVPPDGLVRTTWGLCLRWLGGGIALTWGDDRRSNPYRIEVIEPRQLEKIDSLVLQDVSSMAPWARCVGAPLEGYDVLEFQVEDESVAGRIVPWGVLLRFASGAILVASAFHEDPLRDPECNDEVVIALTPEAIDGLRSARDRSMGGSS